MSELSEQIKQAGLTMEELLAIENDFKAKSASYEQTAQYVANILLKANGVHSVRYRVKNPRHLFLKIVRKKLERKERVLTLEKYEEEITDLAGVRVLHLFKGGWQRIHRFITETWDLKETPTAYYREGDSPEMLKRFSDHGCEVKQHPDGYRSVHYIIKTAPTKADKFIEIQVRTIFEEGWSEIDHKIRYPNFSNNPLTNSLLMMLNRLAGSADEMSSFVQELNYYIKQSELDFKQLEQEKNEQIAKLEEVIRHAKMSAKDKSTLEDVAKSMTAIPHLPKRNLQQLLESFNTTQSPFQGIIDAQKKFEDALGQFPFTNMPGFGLETQMAVKPLIDKINEIEAKKQNAKGLAPTSEETQ